MAQHCACLLHLQRNVQTIFKRKHLIYLIARASRAFRLEDFYVHFNEIKVIDIACADYLIRIGLEHWARSHFSGARYNIMTSNLAESLNAALATARKYPIVSLIEYIRSMMVGWFSSRRGVALKHWSLDLHKRSCSCKEFATLKIPCTHAVSAAVTSKMNVETLVAEEYTNDYWGMAYSGTINPVHGGQVGQTEEGGGGMKLLPPRTRRPPGRPRKCRILSAGEIRGYRVFKRRRTCTRCGGLDHNRTTCRNPIGKNLCGEEQ
ncbi:hypothetical protein F2Q69_00001824 [Brassica cretica]|uniref:SWIM-type domain-containing protein n=1 Tax=Brassica cretica TaxID=69181 RepID=A0A8S9PAF9_BRACR|nr:hypothetical protein F2Q69_00001824 [Brassica cretica]